MTGPLPPRQPRPLCPSLPAPSATSTGLCLVPTSLHPGPPPGRVSWGPLQPARPHPRPPLAAVRQEAQRCADGPPGAHASPRLKLGPPAVRPSAHPVLSASVGWLWSCQLVGMLLSHLGLQVHLKWCPRNLIFRVEPGREPPSAGAGTGHCGGALSIIAALPSFVATTPGYPRTPPHPCSATGSPCRCRCPAPWRPGAVRPGLLLAGVCPLGRPRCPWSSPASGWGTGSGPLHRFRSLARSGSEQVGAERRNGG